LPVIAALPRGRATPDWLQCLDKYRHNLLFDWNERRVIQRVAELWTMFQDREIWAGNIETVLKRLLGWEKLIEGLDSRYAEMINAPIGRKALQDPAEGVGR
jgi:hypothetical protein